MTTASLAEANDLLFAEVVREVARRPLPEATYRLQFHKGFTFRDALAIVPYLHDLGVSHCYASPYLQSRPGSMHGYDITNHQKLNAEIGTEEEYDAWVVALREHGMGHILDTVPNHMGVLGNENPWWNDVLENGPASPYAAYFDIAWQSSPRPELRRPLRTSARIAANPSEVPRWRFYDPLFRQLLACRPVQLRVDPELANRRAESGAWRGRAANARIPQHLERGEPPAGPHRCRSRQGRGAATREGSRQAPAGDIDD
jgi:glycosidase